MKQKVLLLITRLDKGGSAEVTLQLAKGLSEKGYDVMLVSGKTVETAFDVVEYAERNKFQICVIDSLVRNISIKNDILAFF